ncbi:MAG TPA: MarC family protein [Verrucomicrobiae bacterium]|nr:MarC family protein [Verrucomicrobiae bacterium]
MELLKYMLLSAASLFVIMDPIATVPAFLAMTPKDGAEERTRMARLACVIAACVLITFVLTGKTLFRLMGITLPAFKIAGSIVLLLVALDMLRARRSRVQETVEETYAGTEKDDIAITPLAVPMLAGPGAISTTILLHTQSPDIQHTLALLGCIILVCVISYIIFRLAAKGATRFVSPIAMKIVERLMGLLLAAVAIQFAIDGFAELGLLKPPAH